MTQEQETLLAKRAAIAERIVELIDCNHARQQQHSIEVGRELIRWQDTFTVHGTWQKSYKDELEPKIGLPLNTAQRWMRRAREADQKMQRALFDSATDSEAQEIHDAAEAAKKDVDRKLRLILRLELRLSRVEEKDALLRFCRSKRSFVERKVIKLLKKLKAEESDEDFNSAA